MPSMLSVPATRRSSRSSLQEGSRDGWAELGPKNTAYRVEGLWCWPPEHGHPQLFVILGREGKAVIVGQANKNEDRVRNSETV